MLADSRRRRTPKTKRSNDHKRSFKRNKKKKEKNLNSIFSFKFQCLLILICFLLLIIFYQLYNNSDDSVDGGELHDILFIFNNNKNIYTMNKYLPNVDALCIDITIGKFIYIGTEQHNVLSSCRQLPNIRNFTSIDLSSYIILPGLIDSHAHIMMEAAVLNENNIDLSNCLTYRSMIQTIRNYTLNNNISSDSHTWIKCMGYNENKWYDWNKKGLLNRFHLDKSFGNVSWSIILYRIDLHTILLNTNGLNQLKNKINLNNMSIIGGKIGKNHKNELNGLFIDNAKKLITKYLNIHPYYDELNSDNNIKMFKKVINECNKYGLTSVHDMDEKYDIIENVYKKLLDNDISSFNLRLNVYVHGSNYNYDNSELNLPSSYNKYFMYRDRLTVNGVKLFLDGALGSYGAKLISPYCDKQDGWDGLMRYNTINDYYNDIKLWYNNGWQLSTHAIGDAANRIALDSYQKLLNEYNIFDPDKIAELRLRIEHAQVVEPINDIPRFGKLSIIAAMQPTHCTDDMEFAEKRLKCSNMNRLSGAYAWKSMLNNNVTLTFGSDFPAVGKVNPFLGIYAASTRQTAPQKYPQPNGWLPKEKVSIYQAVKSYTIDAAFAAFQENYIGSIEENKFADFIVIDRDIFKLTGGGLALDPLKIIKTNVIATFFGGKLIYHNDSFDLKYLNNL